MVDFSIVFCKRFPEGMGGFSWDSFVVVLTGVTVRRFYKTMPEDMALHFHLVEW
jgi:hypothetical protein